MNALNVTGVRELFNAIMGLREVYSKTYQRVWFDTPILRQPNHQSLQILPEVYSDLLEESWVFIMKNLETSDRPFKGFKDYELQRLQRVIDWMNESRDLDKKYVTMQQADFFKFFNEHDKRRGTDFLKTFPEMREFWEQCKYYAQN
jgi:hypothetical protein